ncbi:SprT family protein [Ornithinibacillus bavariensis]|uniref:Protein SprT n=1 Tax=Ornithinibacillus bavariensis TaxID=545502 RepID=A0A919X7S8_9BACI|nr:SprT family protein [Ornithinibacillus bavariensis]GIO27106.1 protein SprT [Ornithinibacillus bavariensis]
MKLLNEKELEELVNQLSLQFFNKPFVDRVVFNSRLRTTGGRYLPMERLIELNPKYFYEMEHSEFIGIIKHELCHYHLHIEGKGYKHGDKEFKILLKQTGSPRHCKPLPSNLNQKKHQYKCQQCGHIYNRVRKVNIRKFRCGICRGELKRLTK